MGLVMSHLFDVFWSMATIRDVRLLMLGLDAAGKTTILYRIKLNETVTSIPTIGFNVETLAPCKGLSFTVWDVGGQKKIRALWRHYFENAQGLLYVVDSCDRERIPECRAELESILTDIYMQRVPVVVLANKQDEQHALTPSELTEALSLRTLCAHRKWHVQPTCAVSGDGVLDAMDKMSTFLREQNDW